MNVPAVVIVVGVIVGVVMILTTCVVWYRTQKFGLGGGVLTGFGVILMLISIITEVRFEITSTGPKIEILREQLERTAATVELVAQEAQQLAGELETSRENLRQITEVVRRTPDLPLDARIRLRDSVRIPPDFQPATLDSAVMNLGGIRRALSTMPGRDR